jgi:hypothetical protein
MVAMTATQCVVLDASSDLGQRAEMALRRNGMPLPLQQSAFWCGEGASARRLLVLLTDPSGDALVGAAITISRSRLTPGFSIGRVLKFGHGLPGWSLEPLIEALASAARTHRLLRLHIEAFTPDAAQLSLIGTVCASAGLRLLPKPRNYQRTLIVDLTPDEDTLFQSFSRVVRRNVRKTAQLGHVVLLIMESRYASRLSTLGEVTFARTRGRHTPVDWGQRIRTSIAYPESYHLSGLFLAGEPSPDALVAFRWVACQPDGYADDLYAASARLEGPLQAVPLMHAVMWECLRWARKRGAPWFDFGGVVPADDTGNAALRTISAFKRLFTGTERLVGADWVYEPYPRLARAAGLVSRAVRRMRS